MSANGFWRISRGYYECSGPRDLTQGQDRLPSKTVTVQEAIEKDLLDHIGGVICGLL